MGMTVPVVWSPSYEVDIGTHVFPTRKYRLVRERLVTDRMLAPADLHEAHAVTDEQVSLVHDAGYIRRITTGTLSVHEQQVLEVPFSAALRDAAWICAGGSTLTARLALQQGIAIHLGGGFHHAFPDHGEGFCLINDVAIAIRILAREGIVQRVAVVDLDVHHGNGTAAIFRDDPSVFTFSMHQDNNYPADKPPSDVDVGLADGTGDEAYLRLLGHHLTDLLARHRPELIFYLAGADCYRFDQLGGLGLSIDGLRRRDTLVFAGALAHGAPVAVCLAGGYALRTDDTVEIHCNTVRAANDALARGAFTPRAMRPA
jgi:acetoin utilization deacetylase AcuC-like enzyme